MSAALRYDPLLGPEPGAQQRFVRLLAFCALALALHGVVAGGAWVARQQYEAPAPEREALVFVEVPDPPAPPEPSPVPEPPPVPDTPPEVALPEVVPPDVPDPVAEREPLPEPVSAEEPPTPPTDVAPPENVRPISIGLEGNSFSTGGAGPTFARGDRASGGRPDRTSVDPNDTRTAAETVPVAAEEAAPAAAPSGRQGRPPRDRSPRIASGVTANIPASRYPAEAERNEIEADCIAMIDVDADGRVRGVDSVRCTVLDMGFEDVARSHVLDEFRFEPAIRDGVPVAEQVRWTFTFRFDD